MTRCAHSDDVIQNFPSIKLSYETLSHKKVNDADIILAIPSGKKCFVWFTVKDLNKVCYILELGRNRLIEHVHQYPVCFSKELSYGSIFYGTMVDYNNSPFVALEDMFMYKGRKTAHYAYGEKLSTLERVFSKELPSTSPGRHFVSFGMPLFHHNHEELIKLIAPNQRVMYFQYRYLNKNVILRAKPFVVFRSEPTTQPHDTVAPRQDVACLPKKQHSNQPRSQQTTHEKLFNVTPDIQNDIYHLHDNNNEYIGVAYIPDYTTSVMMNKLFRKIKENDNLDALEESDDEDEFESDDVDKFVHLDAKHSMSCTYNRRFKMWVPIKLCDRTK